MSPTQFTWGCCGHRTARIWSVKALVTGGAGFIGSCIAERLLADGAEVRVIDDLSTGRRSDIPAGVEFVEGDICDATALARAMRGADVVFHQAALRSVLRSVESPVATDRVNSGGTLSVLVAARDAGVRRVVSASSSSVYGLDAQRPTPETAVPRPRSPYAVSKLAGEHYCRVFWELYGLETVSLRYFNVYGPRQRAEGQYATVIPLFVDALRRGEAAIIHGDGQQSRDFSYIDDVVACNLAAARAGAERCAGRAYNVAGGETVSVLGVLDHIADVLGVRAAASHTDSRAGDVTHTHADLSQVTADLDWRPLVSFEHGIRATVEWFIRNHG